MHKWDLKDLASFRLEELQKAAGVTPDAATSVARSARRGPETGMRHERRAETTRSEGRPSWQRELVVARLSNWWVTPDRGETPLSHKLRRRPPEPECAA